jgi:hypothetical protein
LPRIFLLSLCPIYGPFEHSVWHLLSRKESLRGWFAKHRLADIARVWALADEYISL